MGREPERQRITTLLTGARLGDGCVLVLSGEPGIGKTALLAQAEALAEGMRTLRAQGVESEQVVPFSGLLQLLRPVLPLIEHIPDPQAAAISSALLLGPAGEGEPSRFAVGAATLSLLARAAEDLPLAVLVDDAHLLDQASAEALVFAARRLVSDAISILVSVRIGEPGSELWATLPTLVIRGLDLEAAHELVTGVSGPIRRDQLVRLHRATAGNPLGLLELGSRVNRLDVLPPESSLAVSELLTRSFLGRADDLAPDARTALLVAAADGASVSTVYGGLHRSRRCRATPC